MAGAEWEFGKATFKGVNDALAGVAGGPNLDAVTLEGFNGSSGIECESSAAGLVAL